MPKKAKDEEVADDGNTRTVRAVEMLPVPLTDPDKVAIGDELAEFHDKKEAQEENLKALKKQLQGEIDKTDAEIKSRVHMLRNGHRYDNIQVSITHDYQHGTVTKTRTDTGEIYQSRPMEDFEMQREMFNRERDKKAEAAESDEDA